MSALSSNQNKEQEDKQPWPRSDLNQKYRRMVGEFVYRGILWVSWTTLERIRTVETTFQFHPDDLILVSYPKSGTTLLQEMVWLLTHGTDTQTASQQEVFIRIPFLEENYRKIYPGDPISRYPLDYLPGMLRPRIIKTHLPFRHLATRFHESKSLEGEGGFKIILALRNPKDTMVSCYHFYRGTSDYGPFLGNWNEFFEMWMDGWIVGGDWIEVVQEWKKVLATDGDNPLRRILCVTFEEMVQTPGRAIERIANFLGITNWRELEAKVTHQTRFEVMRDNPMTNYMDVESFSEDFRFMRRGEVGDWQRWFTVEQNQRFDRVYGPVLADLGLEFNFGKTSTL